MKIQGVGPNQGIERSKSEYRNQTCTRRCRLEREARANLPYRAFARTGDGKVPDAKALGHWRDWDKPSGQSNRASGRGAGGRCHRSRDEYSHCDR